MIGSITLGKAYHQNEFCAHVAVKFEHVIWVGPEAEPLQMEHAKNSQHTHTNVCIT